MGSVKSVYPAVLVFLGSACVLYLRTGPESCVSIRGLRRGHAVSHTVSGCLCRWSMDMRFRGVEQEWGIHGSGPGLLSLLHTVWGRTSRSLQILNSKPGLLGFPLVKVGKQDILYLTVFSFEFYFLKWRHMAYGLSMWLLPQAHESLGWAWQ